MVRLRGLSVIGMLTWGKPVIWDLSTYGAMPEAFDTGRRMFFGLFALIFYIDMDGLPNYHWVHTSNLIDRYEH